MNIFRRIKKTCRRIIFYYGLRPLHPLPATAARFADEAALSRHSQVPARRPPSYFAGAGPLLNPLERLAEIADRFVTLAQAERSYRQVKIAARLAEARRHRPHAFMKKYVERLVVLGENDLTRLPAFRRLQAELDERLRPGPASITRDIAGYENLNSIYHLADKLARDLCSPIGTKTSDHARAAEPHPLDGLKTEWHALRMAITECSDMYCLKMRSPRLSCTIAHFTPRRSL